MRNLHTFKKEEAMKAASIKRTLTALLLIAAVAVAVPAAVQAAGTIAGTGITNQVSVGYTIGGVPGTAVVSTATFTVGVRVNMTVTRSNANFVDVAAGATNAYLTFLVTNITNTRLDFGLVSAVSATNPFNGAANTFVTTPTVTAFVDANGNGIYEPATDTALFSTINTDASTTVFIVANIPAGEANGVLQAFSLTAVARQFGSNAGAVTNLAEGTPYNGVDVVFGDPANGTVAGDASRDARVSDRSAFRVSAITVAKTSTVYSDPFNGVSVNARPIPGAIITYQVTITNPGSSNATNVSVSDAMAGLPVTFRTQFDDGTGLGCTALPAQGIAVDPGTGVFVCRGNSNADGDNADYTGTTLSVTNLTVNAGGTVRVKYQVTVN
jgi:hypothetical protein